MVGLSSQGEALLPIYIFVGGRLSDLGHGAVLTVWEFADPRGEHLYVLHQLVVKGKSSGDDAGSGNMNNPTYVSLTLDLCGTFFGKSLISRVLNLNLCETKAKIFLGNSIVTIIAIATMLIIVIASSWPMDRGHETMGLSRLASVVYADLLLLR